MRAKDPFLVEIGAKIRAIRVGKGMSQEKIAVLCGLERTGLGRIENGQFRSKITTLKAIADVLGCDVKDFL